MRGLFTMLFGASMAIVADRAAARGGSPAAVPYQRMAWLLVIGLAHAYLIWHGEIQAEYAVPGATLFFGIRWPAQIGIASCGELVCESGQISGVAVELKT